MAKAQWKEPPVNRKFGQRSELQHIQSLEGLIKILEERNQLLKYSHDVIKESRDRFMKDNEQLRSLQMRYKWLRAAGVVVEHEGEFKHLKGDDMDKFFESTPQPIYNINASAYTAALSKSMLYGSSVVKMWVDEHGETNGSNP